MHKRKALILAASLFTLVSFGGVRAEASESVLRSFILSSSGETIEISIDDRDCNLTSSNDSIATVEGDKVSVVGEGTCELKTSDGEIFSLKSEGSSNESIILDYEIKDGKLVLSGKDSKSTRVETNSSVNLDDVNSIPEGMVLNEDGTYSATKDGVYYIGEEIISSYTPKLSSTSIDSSAGYSEKLSISDNAEIKGIKSSDENVVKVSNDGTITLVGAGEATVSVDTGSNTLNCSVKSVIPTIDTKDVKIPSGSKYTVKVSNNKAGIPVEYSIKSGSGKISSSGVLSGTSDGTTVVHVKIGSFEYDKKFTTYTAVSGMENFFSDAGEMSESREAIWKNMQPAIQKSLGTPYVMGGTTPGVALDCSGYASYVWRSAGLLNGRLTAQGLYNYSKRTNNPQPGDLVFFHSTYDPGDGRYITHVGVYAGNGTMYHSGEPNQKVSLNNSYWRSHFAGYGTF